MRFIVFVKANKDTEAGVMPSERLLSEMTAYNEQLVKAGVMTAGEGLHPSSKGARITFRGDQRLVTDGPFAETVEQMGGFWVVDLPDLETAVAAAKLLPEAYSVEVRPIVEIGD